MIDVRAKLLPDDAVPPSSECLVELVFNDARYLGFVGGELEGALRDYLTFGLEWVRDDWR